MSYDLHLIKDKGVVFNYQMFQSDVEKLFPLAEEELVYGNEIEEMDLTELNLYDVKHDKIVKKEFINYLKEQGIRLTLFQKIFKKCDLNLVKEFFNRKDDDTLEVLTVFAHPSHKEEFELIIKQMKFLARKYDLRLYDPQVNDYIDVSEDSSEVKYLKQGK